MLHSDCCTSKAYPMKYLKTFLEKYLPNVANKFVVLDQSGELYLNPEVCNLFHWYNYDVYPTGADASY